MGADLEKMATLQPSARGRMSRRFPRRPFFLTPESSMKSGAACRISGQVGSWDRHESWSEGQTAHFQILEAPEEIK